VQPTDQADAIERSAMREARADARVRLANLNRRIDRLRQQAGQVGR